MFLSLRYINRYLTRSQFKVCVQAHFGSKMTFGIAIWGRSITTKERQKLNINLNCMARLLCKDFKKTHSKRELYENSALRSFSSTCIMAEAHVLYNLATEMTVEPLSVKLMSQSYIPDRFPDRIRFFDYSQNKAGRDSFINRAKCISERIPFDWLNLKPNRFKIQLK